MDDVKVTRDPNTVEMIALPKAAFEAFSENIKNGNHPNKALEILMQAAAPWEKA